MPKCRAMVPKKGPLKAKVSGPNGPKRPRVGGFPRGGVSLPQLSVRNQRSHRARGRSRGPGFSSTHPSPVRSTAGGFPCLVHSVVRVVPARPPVVRGLIPPPPNPFSCCRPGGDRIPFAAMGGVGTTLLPSASRRISDMVTDVDPSIVASAGSCRAREAVVDSPKRPSPSTSVSHFLAGEGARCPCDCTQSTDALPTGKWFPFLVA